VRTPHHARGSGLKRQAWAAESDCDNRLASRVPNAVFGWDVPLDRLILREKPRKTGACARTARACLKPDRRCGTRRV